MNEKLLETVADIAHYAGQKGYYSGDSRVDMADFIGWAKELERLHRFTDWGWEDYMLAVEEYAEEKIAGMIAWEESLS